MERRPELLPSSSALSPAPAQHPPPAATGRAVPKGHCAPCAPCAPWHPEMSLAARCALKDCPWPCALLTGELCPGPGQVTLQCPHAGTQSPLPGLTRALGSSLPALACSSDPTALLSPLAPSGPALLGPRATELPKHQPGRIELPALHPHSSASGKAFRAPDTSSPPAAHHKHCSCGSWGISRFNSRDESVF